MVDFLFALFGGAYVGAKLEADRKKSETAKREIWSHQVSDESWFDKHTDKALESSLWARMDDPSFYEEILKEVLPAFEKMPSWSYRTGGVVVRADQLSAKMAKSNVKTRQNFIIRERNIVLDIMLANRGKVSTTAANFGYDAPNRALISGSDLDRREELARWIEATLQDQGVDVKLTYRQNEAGDRKYVWVGSHAYRSTLKF